MAQRNGILTLLYVVLVLGISSWKS